MAIDLKAVFSVQDRGSAKLRKIAQQMENLDKASKKSSNGMGNFGSKIGGIVGGASKLVSALNPMALAFSAVGAAAAASYASVKVFNATVAEAMKMEQSQVMISAMFDDKKLSDSYMKMMDRVAIDSPLLDSQAMYSNSKSFVAVSKDVKQLEKMWSLTERLVASDPAQGLEGAVFALRELFSGDAISMVERFEMPRDAMNAIKKMDLDGQLKALDDFMNKMGFTEKLIGDMGNTALGKWTQVKERMQLIARDMGMPSVSVISDFLSDVTSRLEGADMQKFANWGANVIQSMLTGLTNSATRLYDWFTNLINDPEFKKLTTLSAKVDFIITDIAEKLQSWYDGGGKEKLEKFAKLTTETLISALNASEAFAQVGANMGASIWQGIISGVKASATQNPLGKVVQGLYYASPIGAATELYNKITGKKSGGGKAPKGNYHGLSNVPYDGYTTRLHKNEAVLTAKENKEYQAAKEGKGSLGGNVTVTGNHFIVREEADIDRIAMALAKQIEKEALQIG